MIDKELSNELTRFFRLLNEQRSTPSPPPGKWGAVLNSPFIVTVLGGIVLAVLSLTLQERVASEREKTQQRSADEREYNARLAVQREKKHVMMGEFANRMTLFLQCAPDVRLRSIFLAANREPSLRETAQFHDGRNWKETVERYEVSAKHLNTLASPDSLCAQAIATFESPEVIKEIELLDGLMDRYNQTRAREEFTSISGEASAKLQCVILLMGKELKSSQAK